MTGARRLPNGLLRPWVCDYMDGVAEARRLSTTLGLELDLPPDQVHALGVATAQQGQGLPLGQDLSLSAEGLEALARVVAARSRPPTPATSQALDQDQGPDPGPRPTSLTKGNGSSWIFEPCLTWANALQRVQHPAFVLGSWDAEGPEQGPGPDQDHGQSEIHTRANRRNPGVKDEVAWYLANVPDPDDEKWS